MSTLLLVDDELAILTAISRCFMDVEDLTVLSANSAPEAVKILSREPVDCIISDERMPLVAGSEFLRFVKDKYPDIPRIILTGYADQEATIRAVNEAGVFRYLQKPWEPQELRDVVAQALAFRQTALTHGGLNLKVLKEKKEAEAKADALEQQIKKRNDQLNQSVELLKRRNETIDHYRVDILNVFLAMTGLYEPPSAWLARQISALYRYMCKAGTVKHTDAAEGAAFLCGLLTNTEGRLFPLLDGLEQFSGSVATLHLLPENFNGTGPQGIYGPDLPEDCRLLRIIHDYYKVNASFPGGGTEHLKKNSHVFYDPAMVQKVLAALEMKANEGETRMVKPKDLMTGMVLAKAIVLGDGTILPERSFLGDVQILRIRNMGELNSPDTTVAVLV